MKNKRNVLSCLMLLVGVIYFSAQAQQKNGTHRANFSGEWRSKESISMGGNIVCTYDAGDRMLATTMKVAQQSNFMTIEATSSYPGVAPVTSREKLTFDGKATYIGQPPIRGKKFTVKLSVDSQIMTVNSIVFLKYPQQKQQFVYVTEVWKLSNDGESISIQTSAKATLFSGERSWTTVFNRATWYSKLFSTSST
jgi:hypothetical protein